ncbi:hypothetical protein QBC38DRAFT_16208 [Podospora fimiseda]|uniref:Attractin/MKLN-like beta-propeller domain-containing protein n=1 Tax=Podospora fimiseda TaxID=252190 RepID=A0AAN7BJJ7_9PEZI|nr:hypothetical protein QBC38DRAFT_16208 [Podospora fimiseda]
MIFQHFLLPLFLFFLSLDLSVAQYDPIRDFCRRFGHQSAVVDNRLYIDGGLVNWKPFTASSQNYTNPFLTFTDLKDITKGMPTQYANLSKNATVPSVNGGILWEDSVNKRLYLYGGESYQFSPTSFLLWAYDILKNQWDSFGPPTGRSAIVPTSYGAGVSVPDRGEAYYYGGLLNNQSVAGWSGPPQASNRMIKYDMDSNSWSDLTGPDDVKRAEGEMVYIPVGDAGMLVYFGGSRDLWGNGTFVPQPLDTIFLYDIANDKWYPQKTSGRTPEVRRRFCGGATWAQDQSSYNIYIYGGYAFPPDTTGYDDIYVLTIPSFQWIRGPYPVGSNVSGPYPKNMASCNVVNHAQMLIIGGTYSNDTTFMCDVEAVGGQHNMNLGQQNSATAIWAEYEPTLTTYAVPTFILSAVGGTNTGGARVTAPTGGFDAPDLAVQMGRKAKIQSRSPTRDVSGPTSSSILPPPPEPSSSKALGAGAIAGIAVGGAVVLIALLVGCCFFIRHRQKHYEKPRHPAGPSMQNFVPSGWGGSTANHSISSPTITHASYMHPPYTPHRQNSPVQLPSSPARLPVELGTDNTGAVRSPRSFTSSPVSAKYDTPSWVANVQAVNVQRLSPVRTPTFTAQDLRAPQPLPSQYWTSSVQEESQQFHQTEVTRHGSTSPYLGIQGSGNHPWDGRREPSPYQNNSR